MAPPFGDCRRTRAMAAQDPSLSAERLFSVWPPRSDRRRAACSEAERFVLRLSLNTWSVVDVLEELKHNIDASPGYLPAVRIKGVSLPRAVNPTGDASASLVRADVLVMLREKRYEDALARLYQARTESPDSVELQRSIDQVKEFLIGAYARRLGGLDQVARPFATSSARSPDVVLLSRYIDGATTYGDLAEMSPLGRLRTLQVLIEMYVRQPASSVPVDHAGVPGRSGHPSLAVGEPEASGSHRVEPLQAVEHAGVPAQSGHFSPVDYTGVPGRSGHPSPVDYTGVPGRSGHPSPVDYTGVPGRSGHPSPVDYTGVPGRSGHPSPVEHAVPGRGPSPVEEDPDTRQYREAFARGTAAFIQNRFADAIEAFEACAQLRPGDASAEVMLRRARRDLESR
jgi:hypothetical protein